MSEKQSLSVSAIFNKITKTALKRECFVSELPSSSCIGIAVAKFSVYVGIHEKTTNSVSVIVKILKRTSTYYKPNTTKNTQSDSKRTHNKSMQQVKASKPECSLLYQHFHVILKLEDTIVVSYSSTGSVPLEYSSK